MKKKLKLNVGFCGYAAGSIIDIDINDEGVPSDGFWRRRLRDAKIDNCVELVAGEKHPKKKSDDKEL